MGNLGLDKVVKLNFAVPVMILVFVGVAVVQRNIFGIGSFISPSSGS